MVIQGYWQWCHSIGHLRFPIRPPLELCLNIAPFQRSLTFQNLNISHDSEHIPFEGNIVIMHAILLLCIKQHANLKYPSINNSKDMTGGKILKHRSHDPDHAH